MKIKKGDTIKVIRGKDKGKTGSVEMVMDTAKVLVKGINQYKKHVKKRSERDKSEIVTIAKPLPISNVAVICPSCKKPSRIGLKGEGRSKTRVCKKCGKEI